MWPALFVAQTRGECKGKKGINGRKSVMLIGFECFSNETRILNLEFSRHVHFYVFGTNFVISAGWNGPGNCAPLHGSPASAIVIEIITVEELELLRY
jgi:hypothetical protein